MHRKNYSCDDPPEELVKIDKTWKVRFVETPNSTGQAGVVKDDNCSLDFKTRPSLSKGKTSKNQFGCIEKDTEYGDCSNNYIKSSPHSCVIRENEISSLSEPCNLAGDVVTDENYTLDAKSEPSSTKGKLSKTQSGCTVVFRGNDMSSLLESRNLARAFWAVMAGFGVGLFYGLFNSYTNISFYDCVCYVICLTLYLIFF